VKTKSGRRRGSPRKSDEDMTGSAGVTWLGAACVRGAGRRVTCA
jgi:hypothetical protein